MEYKDYCEHIYKTWRTDPEHLIEFDSDFNMFSLPEPYFPIKKGKNCLAVLNNNPGGVLSFQRRSNILNKFDSDAKYCEVADWLLHQYTEGGVKLNGSANGRIKRMIEIAEVIDCDGVENVETFFLHSNSFNKTKFIKTHFSKSEIVRNYIEALEAYLKDKAVLIVACVASQSTLNLDLVLNSDWLCRQTKIAGLELRKAKFMKVTEKGGKVTSGIFRFGNKVLVCNMGSNNIPKDTAEKLSRWLV